VHWGTFNLALHAWDDPAETLLQLAPKSDTRLIMPKLGEPVEPAHEFVLTPWWRSVDSQIRTPRREKGTRMPKAMPFPPD
jgi:hypothetical protein